LYTTADVTKKFMRAIKILPYPKLRTYFPMLN